MYLGLDLGTSGLKALLMDDGQQVVDTANASLSVSRPHAAWSEQAPSDWTDAATTAVDELRSRRPREVAAVTGIGLSGQQHGATLLDTNDEVLRPCILWNDTRAAEEAKTLDAHPTFHRIAGNTCFAGFTAPKLNWTATHEPDIRARVAKVLLPKDYLRLWLSGEHVSEMSDASGTGWLDIAKRDWSNELLALCELSQDHMPRLVEGSEASAQLRPTLAERWGMTAANVVIAGGAGDNAAAAMGMGAVTPGVGFVSLGTSGVLFAVSDGFAPDPASAVHAFCHAMPDTWHQMGVILSATDSLNWLSGVLGKPAHALTAALEGEQQRPGTCCFCLTSAASARRSTTPARVAPSSASGTPATMRRSPVPSSRASHSRWPIACSRCAARARRSTASPPSAAAPPRPRGCRSSQTPLDCRSTYRPRATSARRSAPRVSACWRRPGPPSPTYALHRRFSERSSRR